MTYLQVGLRKRSILAAIVALLTIIIAGQAGANQQRPTFVFTADRHVILPGQCVTIGWSVENASEVRYNGEIVTGQPQSRQECPTDTTTYYLDIIGLQGEQIRVPLQIDVSGSDPDSINFYTADRTTINNGECANISWNVVNIKEIYYQGQPTTGDNQTRQECPTVTTTYYLTVVENDGNVVDVPLRIYVNNPDPSPIISFWADRTSIKKGECVNIGWQVENVREVYYRKKPTVGGVQNRVECPKSSKTYELHVLKNDGNIEERQIRVTVQK